MCFPRSLGLLQNFHLTITLVTEAHGKADRKLRIQMVRIIFFALAVVELLAHEDRGRQMARYLSMVKQTIVKLAAWTVASVRIILASQRMSPRVQGYCTHSWYSSRGMSANMSVTFTSTQRQLTDQQSQNISHGQVCEVDISCIPEVI